MRALDVSAYGGHIEPHLFADLRFAGIELVIVQAYGGGPSDLGPNPWCQTTLRDALEAGLYVAAYTYPSWKWPNALENCGPYVPQLRFLALDVEAQAGAHQDQIADLRARNVLPVIYTSYSYWGSIMGPRSDFADVPLWDAGYWEDLGPENWPSDLSDRFTPYGGWDSRMGWQFKGTTVYHGVSCDLNLFDDAFIVAEASPPPAPAPAEPPITVQEHLQDLLHRVGELEQDMEILHRHFLEIVQEMETQEGP